MCSGLWLSNKNLLMIKNLILSNLLKWKASYNSQESCAVKKLWLKDMIALQNYVHKRDTIIVTVFQNSTKIILIAYLLQNPDEDIKFVIKGEQFLKILFITNFSKTRWGHLKNLQTFPIWYNKSNNSLWHSIYVSATPSLKQLFQANQLGMS